MSIKFELARRETATLCLPAMIAGTGERAEWALRRVLHRQYSQPEHAGRLRTGGGGLPALVRNAGHLYRCRSAPRACGGLCRAITGAIIRSHGQAAPRLHPHDVRLAGDRPGGAGESSALGPGAALFR
jgi:hypothetical protein